jgi:hypothetical protein
MVDMPFLIPDYLLAARMKRKQLNTSINGCASEMHSFIASVQPHPQPGH